MSSSGEYHYDSSVDMSNYVPIEKRFHGACRCPICSQNPAIVKFYANDFMCKSDGLACDYEGICFKKIRGSVRYCSRFVKPVIRHFWVR